MSGPITLLDTTVFCGALVKPNGLNMRLLKLGASPLYKPLISQTVIAEFIHKACTDGIGKGDKRRLYSPEEIHLFLESFGEILNPDESIKINLTYKQVLSMPGDTPLWVILSKVSTHWPTNKDLSKTLNKPVQETDLGDLHVALAAIETKPDILVSSNLKDLAYLQSICQVMAPSEFLRSIDALEDGIRLILFSTNNYTVFSIPSPLILQSNTPA